MYGIQWFKVDRNIFNNRKIQLLLKKRDGDLYFRVWIQLLSIAVECGNDGRLGIGEKPITYGDCAKIMGKTSDKIRRIMEEFLELGMLKKEGETFLIKIGRSTKVLINMKIIKKITGKDKENIVKS